MNTLFSKILDDHTPRFNQTVVDGLAVRQMRDVEHYIDSVFRNVAKSYPPGLEYVGATRASPREEYYFQTKENGGKRKFSIAQSDFYLLNYHFTWHGKPLPPKPMSIPFCRDYGIMYVNGTAWYIRPMLSYKALAPMDDSIFVRLLCDKVKFRRSFHQFIVNGKYTTTTVVFSNLHRKDTKTSKSKTNEKDRKPVPTMFHYLVARFGLQRAFERAVGFMPILMPERDLKREDYPESDWVLVKSVNQRPAEFISKAHYPGAPGYVFAIPRENWNNVMKAMVSGFFYVTDIFPSRFHIADDESWRENIDNVYTWSVTLGYVNLGTDQGDGRVLQRMDKHFKSLDSYVDIVHQQRLKEQGVDVADFYDLMLRVMEHFDAWTSEAGRKGRTAYNKILDVRYSVAFEVTKNIFLMLFDLIDKDVDKGLQVEDEKAVIRALSCLLPRSSYKITKDSPIMVGVECSGDNIYACLTSRAAVQAGPPTDQRGGGVSSAPSEEVHVHPSSVEVGSTLNLSKTERDPLCRINPFVHLAPDGTVVPNPDLIDTIKELIAVYRVRTV